MTETPNNLNGLFGEPSERTDEKIAKELFTDKDLSTKTALRSPLRWSTLQMIQLILAKNNLSLSNSRISEWIHNAMLNLISEERKGRTEFIAVIEALAQKEKDKTGGSSKWV